MKGNKLSKKIAIAFVVVLIAFIAVLIPFLASEDDLNLEYVLNHEIPLEHGYYISMKLDEYYYYDGIKVYKFFINEGWYPCLGSNQSLLYKEFKDGFFEHYYDYEIKSVMSKEVKLFGA